MATLVYKFKLQWTWIKIRLSCLDSLSAKWTQNRLYNACLNCESINLRGRRTKCNFRTVWNFELASLSAIICSFLSFLLYYHFIKKFKLAVDLAFRLSIIASRICTAWDGRVKSDGQESCKTNLQKPLSNVQIWMFPFNEQCNFRQHKFRCMW